MKLEQEFEVYKAEHKYSVALAYLMSCYIKVQTIAPEWLGGSTPEEKAKKHLREMYEEGKLNNFYEKAYDAISEFLN